MKKKFKFNLKKAQLGLNNMSADQVKAHLDNMRASLINNGQKPKTPRIFTQDGAFATNNDEASTQTKDVLDGSPVNNPNYNPQSNYSAPVAPNGKGVSQNKPAGFFDQPLQLNWNHILGSYAATGLAGFLSNKHANSYENATLRYNASVPPTSWMPENPNPSLQGFYGGNMQKGGTHAPIITHDKNDPRLRAYNDSLKLYNSNVFIPYGEEVFESTENFKKSYKNVLGIFGAEVNGKHDANFDPKIKPIDYAQFRHNREYFKNNDPYITLMFKKPVQPYVYKPEEVPQLKRDTSPLDVSSRNIKPTTPSRAMTSSVANQPATDYQYTVSDGTNQHTVYFPNLDAFNAFTEANGYEHRDVSGDGKKAQAVGYPRMQRGGQATTQDSLDLYNSSLKVLNYYNNPKYKKSIESYGKISNAHKLNDQKVNDFLDWNKDGMTITVPANGGTKRVEAQLPLNQYRRDIDSNKYLQRERAFYAMDTRAPFQLFDKRIAPTYLMDSRNETQGDVLQGDAVQIYSYDPISVKPWNMLTDAERKLRVQRYGYPQGYKAPSKIDKTSQPHLVKEMQEIPPQLSRMNAPLPTRGLQGHEDITYPMHGIDLANKPTNYSFTLGDGSKQHTVYFPNLEAFKSFTDSNGYEHRDISGDGKSAQGTGYSKMQKGGTLPPIYVNDPNDPRIKAYQDSVYGYNWGINMAKKVEKTGKSLQGTPVEVSNPDRVSRNEEMLRRYNEVKKFLPDVKFSDIRKEYDAIDYVEGRVKNSATSFLVYPRLGKDGHYSLAQYDKPKQPYLYKGQDQKLVKVMEEKSPELPRMNAPLPVGNDVARTNIPTRAMNPIDVRNQPSDYSITFGDGDDQQTVYLPSLDVFKAVTDANGYEHRDIQADGKRAQATAYKRLQRGGQVYPQGNGDMRTYYPIVTAQELQKQKDNKDKKTADLQARNMTYVSSQKQMSAYERAKQEDKRRVDWENAGYKTDDAGHPTDQKFLYKAGDKVAPVEKVGKGLLDMSLLMDGAMLAKGAGKMIAKDVAEALPELAPNAYKLNPWAKGNVLNKWNPNAFYRIVDEEGGADALATGVVRPSPTGTKSTGESGMAGNKFTFDLSQGRKTGFPSFAKGKPDVTYMPEEGNGYIFESEIPMFRRGDTNPVTGNKIKSGHWAYRPIDMQTGKVMNEIPLDQTKMYKQDWLRGFKEVPQEGKVYAGNNKSFSTGYAWKNGVPVNNVTGKTAQEEYVENLKNYYNSEGFHHRMDTYYPDVDKEAYIKKTLQNLENPITYSDEPSKLNATGIYVPKSSNDVVYAPSHTPTFKQKVKYANTAKDWNYTKANGTEAGHSYVRNLSSVDHELSHQRTNADELLPEYLSKEYLMRNAKPELTAKELSEGPYSVENYYSDPTEFEVRMRQMREDIKKAGIKDYFDKSPFHPLDVERLMVKDKMPSPAFQEFSRVYKDYKAGKASSAEYNAAKHKYDNTLEEPVINDDTADLLKYWNPKFLAEQMNKLPVALPVAGAVGAAALSKKQKGGPISWEDIDFLFGEEDKQLAKSEPKQEKSTDKITTSQVEEAVQQFDNGEDPEELRAEDAPALFQTDAWSDPEFKRGGLVNNTGYLPGTPTANNPINIIPSKHITMATVPHNVLAFPANGRKLGKPVVMQPDSDYIFDADHTVELALGGEYDLTPEHIAYLKKLGYDIEEI